MLRKLLITTIPFAALIVFCSLIIKENGRAGATGSPGENTCYNSCHNTYALNSGTGSITLLSPSTPAFQYTPGTTYNMTVKVAYTGDSLFGVGIEALTTTNNNAGTLNLTDLLSTQIKNSTVSGVSRRNIVHTFGGGANPDYKDFNFSWTAPAAGTGNVTFYYAGIAANGHGNGNENNDHVYNSSQVFTELTCNPPPQPSTINGNTTLCAGNAAAYSITPVAGATSYTWTLPSGWTGSSTTTSINATAGINSGNILVTANSSCGSSPASTLAVTANSVAATAAKTDISCNGNANGSATVTVTSGLAPYTYVWSPSGGSGATANNLGPGTYTVLVTDSRSCTNSLSVTITQPAVLNATVTNTNPSCFGQMGSAVVAPTGGTSPYVCTWSSGGTGTTSSNLAQGSYTVTVTDAHGCTKTSSTTITQPAQLTVGVSSTNPQCSTGSGTATATPAGGTSPYTYLWSPSGGTAVSANNLTSGTYTVKVTDSHGCSITSSAVTVSIPAAITASVSATNPLCWGGTGSATVTAGGGTIPYTYLWSSSGGTGTTASSLNVGTYTVTVTDSHGCTKTSSTAITQPAHLLSSINATSPLCGTGTGSATAVPTGGTTPYTYQWSPSGGTTASAVNLTTGSYTVIITDAHNCTASSTASITVPPLISLSVTTTDAACGSANGTASVLPTGGTLPFSFSWSTTPVQTNDTAVNLGAGSYVVTVTDGHGCTKTSSATVNQPSTLNVTSTATDVNCNGGTDGQASISITGGTPGYTIVWNTVPAQDSVIAINLQAGSYTAIVTDSVGCSFSETVVVSEPAILNASAGMDTSLCAGGSIIIGGSPTASGGTSGFAYLWSPSAGLSSDTAANPIATPLSSGAYIVTITDAHNCTAVSSVTLSINNLPVPVISTFGDTLISTQGATYLWYLNGNSISGAINSTYLPVQNGDYSVVVTDVNGCSGTSAIYTVTTVGVEKVNRENKIFIYPNPATTWLTIKINNNTENNSIVIYDITGRVVLMKNIKAGTDMIDLGGIAEGVYTITAGNSNLKAKSQLLISK